MNGNINRSKALAFSLSALVFLAGCATPLKSTIDQADNADLSEFATYAWISETPYVDSASSLENPLNYQRVRSSIESELAQKGYRKVDRDEADFVLGFSLGTRDRVRVQHYYDSFGYSFGYPRRFSRFGGFNRFGYGRNFALTPAVRTITEGTLAVDVFDNRSRSAIWHGMATRSLTGDPTGEELISAAVAALIGELPESMVASAFSADDDEAHGLAM